LDPVSLRMIALLIALLNDELPVLRPTLMLTRDEKWTKQRQSD
jgi:hypothetical protein